MPTAARAPPSSATPPSKPASPAPAPHLGGDASTTFSSEPRPLRNISNFCYVNSVISALIPTGILNDHGPASRALHREASGHAAMGPYVLTASFSLRHVAPTWRYDGSQQDASEYLAALFHGLGNQGPRNWIYSGSRRSSSSAPDSSRAGHGETSGSARCLVRYSGAYCTEWPTEFIDSRGCALRRGSQASLFAFRTAQTDQHTAVDSCRSGGIAQRLGSVLHISHWRWTT